jgi:hypothetical protein
MDCRLESQDDLLGVQSPAYWIWLSDESIVLSFELAADDDVGIGAMACVLAAGIWKGVGRGGALVAFAESVWEPDTPETAVPFDPAPDAVSVPVSVVPPEPVAKEEAPEREVVSPPPPPVSVEVSVDPEAGAVDAGDVVEGELGDAVGPPWVVCATTEEMKSRRTARARCLMDILMKSSNYGRLVIAVDCAVNRNVRRAPLAKRTCW